MEIALVSAAMVGVGMAYVKATSRISDATSSPPSMAMTASAAPSRLPDAANSKAGLYASASSKSHVTPGTEGFEHGTAPGALGGRRDTSLFVDATSPYERAMERIYRPPAGSKREVEQTMDMATKNNNVFVRSNIGYRDEFFKTLEKPVRMHNVNPIATTSGTASQLVGPGIGVGSTQLTGDHGFHYGAVRMKPFIVQNTFREQKGLVVPGKNLIDAREATPYLHDHLRTGYTIGTAGVEAMEAEAQPLRFHAISEEYLTSALGRASVTAPSGAGGKRLYPTASHTNRGTESADVAARGTGSVLAATSRQGYVHDPSLSTDRGRLNEYLGPASGSTVQGYAQAIANYNIPYQERECTEQLRGTHVLNVSNPGQPAPMSPELDSGARARGSVPATQRQTLGCGFALTNVSPQVPLPGQGTTHHTDGHTDSHSIDQRQTQRVPNEFRPGILTSAASPDRGGQYNLHGAYSDGSLASRTQRESHEATAYEAPLKTVGLNAPMSYSDVLQSEGYSNRDLPQLPFVPPASPPVGANVHMGMHAIGAFDVRPEPDNSTRPAGGGVANQSMANFYIRNTSVPHNANPNRAEKLNTRLDAQILEALMQNELHHNISGTGTQQQEQQEQLQGSIPRAIAVGA